MGVFSQRENDQLPEADVLRAWALRIAARRGKQIAVVALARRLAGILYALQAPRYRPDNGPFKGASQRCQELIDRAAGRRQARFTRLMPVARIVDGLMKDAASVLSRLAGSHH